MTLKMPMHLEIHSDRAAVRTADAVHTLRFIPFTTSTRQYMHEHMPHKCARCESFGTTLWIRWPYAGQPAEIKRKVHEKKPHCSL